MLNEQCKCNLEEADSFRSRSEWLSSQSLWGAPTLLGARRMYQNISLAAWCYNPRLQSCAEGAEYSPLSVCNGPSIVLDPPAIHQFVIDPSGRDSSGIGLSTSVTSRTSSARSGSNSTPKPTRSFGHILPSRKS